MMHKVSLRDRIVRLAAIVKFAASPIKLRDIIHMKPYQVIPLIMRNVDVWNLSRAKKIANIATRLVDRYEVAGVHERRGLAKKMIHLIRANEDIFKHGADYPQDADSMMELLDEKFPLMEVEKE